LRTASARCCRRTRGLARAGCLGTRGLCCVTRSDELARLLALTLGEQRFELLRALVGLLGDLQGGFRLLPRLRQRLLILRRPLLFKSSPRFLHAPA
jgi:hypothetical protein